jgi:hypothetical protein
MAAEDGELALVDSPMPGSTINMIELPWCGDLAE